MKKIFIQLTLTLSLFFLFSCGGDTDSNNSSEFVSEKIEIKTKHTILDPSEKRFFLALSIKSLYPEGTTVKLSNISIEIYEKEKEKVCSISGSTFFNKTLTFYPKEAPQSMEIVFDFRQKCVPTEYTIIADSYATYDDTFNKSTYKSEPQIILIDENLTIGDSDSTFKLQAIDGSSKIGVDKVKRYKLLMSTHDTNKTTYIPSRMVNENIQKITITSSDTSRLKLIEPRSYRTKEEKELQRLSFTKLEDVDLYIRSGTISGVANLDIEIDYLDEVKNIHYIKNSMYLTILSGEPTAFSINNAGSEYDSKSKWFKQKFLISASDKYSNPINSSPNITVSAMIDFKDNNGEGNRVVYGKSTNIYGNLLVDKENKKASFESNAYNTFNTINRNRDFLFLFGDVTQSEALGKWEIDLENNGDNKLSLTETYTGEPYEKLGFAVGHNYMIDICSNESKEWIVKIDSTDGQYKLDKNGEAYVTLKFPPYLIGKTIAIGVNFSGKKRAGEVHFETLKNSKGVKPPEKIQMDKNTTNPIVRTRIYKVDGTGKDIIYIYNSAVKCERKIDNIEILDIEENHEIKSYLDCPKTSDVVNSSDVVKSSDVAFIELTIKLKDLTKSGSIKFENCQVSSFFNF